MQKAMLNPTPDQTFEVIGEGPYDFPASCATAANCNRRAVSRRPATNVSRLSSDWRS